MKLSERQRFAGLWLLWSLVAALACCVSWKAVHVDGGYLPISNDSFYHARRILDTAADPSAFYEFDPKIHAPEGSLLCWPWGYDYALGWLVRIAGAVGVPGPPIAFLVWVPVAAVFVSIGLMMLIARRLSMSLWSTSLAALCVALSPLTTILHGVGMIDHHYAEYIFVLATLASGLARFTTPESTKAAVTLGVTLGLAPVVHNGSFILQIPVLLTLLLYWLQGQRMPWRSTVTFCAALLGTTLLILIPSLPARLGHFEFYTLSWFHLYVAAGTSVFAVLFSRLPRTGRSLVILTVAGIVLLAPLARQVLLAHAFLVGTISRLDAILEMHSPLRLTNQMGGLWIVPALYSLTIYLTPLTAIYCVVRGWRERRSARLLLWVSSLLGLALLLMQFRLHYYGSFALFLPWLVALDELLVRRAENPERRKQIKLAALLALLLLYAVPMRYFFLAAPPPAAADPNFSALRPILETLKQHCATQPGVVLADNDAGHYIRYYTDCSVIANNFLLTPQHEAKIALIDQLTALTAEELPSVAPYVRYVLLRPATLNREADDKVAYMSYSPKSARLLNQLLLGTEGVVPANYILLNQMEMTVTKPGAAAEVLPVIRLYEVRQLQ